MLYPCTPPTRLTPTLARVPRAPTVCGARGSYQRLRSDGDSGSCPPPNMISSYSSFCSPALSHLVGILLVLLLHLLLLTTLLIDLPSLARSPSHPAASPLRSGCKARAPPSTQHARRRWPRSTLPCSSCEQTRATWPSPWRNSLPPQTLVFSRFYWTPEFCLPSSDETCAGRVSAGRVPLFDVAEPT